MKMAKPLFLTLAMALGFSFAARADQIDARGYDWGASQSGSMRAADRTIAEHASLAYHRISAHPSAAMEHMTQRERNAEDKDVPGSQINRQATTTASGLAEDNISTRTESSRMRSAPMGEADASVSASDNSSFIREVEQAIRNDQSLSDAAKKNVQVSADDGAVTLRGTVNSQDEKTRIADAARACPGVTSVENLIEVTGPSR